MYIAYVIIKNIQSSQAPLPLLKDCMLHPPLGIIYKTVLRHYKYHSITVVSTCQESTVRHYVLST